MKWVYLIYNISLTFCCQTTHYVGCIVSSFKLAEWPMKGSQRVCRSLEGFSSLPSHILSRFPMLQNCWKSGFLCGARREFLHLPNPSNFPDLYVNIWQVHSSQLINMVPDTACFCLSVALEFTVGWISTLACGMNTKCWPERFSVVYCMHIVQTHLMHKNHRYPQKSMFTATDGPTDMPFVVLGYFVLVVHIAVNLLNMSWTSSNSWNFIQ